MLGLEAASAGQTTAVSWMAGSQSRLQGQSSGWEAHLARRSATTLGQALPPLGPGLSPTEADRSVPKSSPLSSVEASRCRRSAPGKGAARTAGS